MTIEDQIKDEKLQYDTNKEAAKISALPSGKIDNYEYLTGEEILPSNQQQIIQQAKFAYSPLGKAFEKQVKTIEVQGKKQVEAIQDNKQLVNINKDDDYKDKLLLSKEREIFKDIYNKRLDKIEELSNKIDYDNLKYVIVGTGDKYNFDNLDDPLTLLNNIKKGEISMKKAIEKQHMFFKYLNIIRIGNKNDNQKRTDKLDITRGQKTAALSDLSIYSMWKNVKSSYNNNKFKISPPTWSEEFELPDGSYSVSDIQDYFEYILKKHSESVDNPSIRMYINRIENRITFKIKNRNYLELLTPETMKLLGSTESKITKDKNGENVPHLEVVELVLVHCNLVNNDYQQDSRILYTFVPNKTFGSLLEISPTNQVVFENI